MGCSVSDVGKNISHFITTPARGECCLTWSHQVQATARSRPATHRVMGPRRVPIGSGESEPEWSNARAAASLPNSRPLPAVCRHSDRRAAGRRWMAATGRLCPSGWYSESIAMGALVTVTAARTSADLEPSWDTLLRQARPLSAPPRRER